jgi:large subunit ribosomal protein L28
VLNASFKMRITTHALRSIEINGGLDKYLISASSEKLSSEALSLKKRIKKASIIQVG